MMFKPGDLVNIIWNSNQSTGSIPVAYIKEAMKGNPYTIKRCDGWFVLDRLDYWWSPEILAYAMDLKNPDWEI